MGQGFLLVTTTNCRLLSWEMDLPPLTPTMTRQLLDEIGMRPRKNLGQNFLIEPNLVRKSIAMAEVADGERVVEIGPGLGTLTRGLLTAGAEVYAVEKDSALLQHLRENLLSHCDNKLHLLEADALEHPRGNLREGDAFKVVANLPYAITTPWLEKVLMDPVPDRMVLLMQKEAAQRVLAGPGTKSFGPISIFVQAAYSLADRHKVSPRCFFPVPDIDSTLVRLDRKAEPFLFSQRQRKIIRQIFKQRRKQLKSQCMALNLGDWMKTVIAADLPETVRPEQVPVKLWMQLHES
jgi:16S rRNA (adenine1518-N6/adenine1519-N6)-dimethyltransferase